MFPACLRHALLGAPRRIARTRLSVTFQDAVLVRTLGISPSGLSETARHQICVGIPRWCHQQSAPQLHRRARAFVSIVEPTGRRRSADTRLKAAAMRLPLMRCSHFVIRHLPILKHACVQPLLDEPHNAFVCNSVLDEFGQPFVIDRTVKVTYVCIEHPVHFLRH